MRIQKISVTGLYGVFNHEIPMDNPERVTIIHGPNGFGKTVMLKMISAALEGEAAIFRRTPFDQFCVAYSDGSTWAINRRLEQDEFKRTPEPILEMVSCDTAGQVTRTILEQFGDLPATVLAMIDRQIPGRYRRLGAGWKDIETNRVMSVSEILSRFPSAINVIPPEFAAKITDRRWRLESMPVFVVETNRLDAALRPADRQEELRFRMAAHDIDEDVQPRALRVQQYSKDVVQRIKSVLADYAKHSQERDRTFPERLVQFVREGRRTLEGREILDKMQELEKKRQRLISLGFLDSETGLRDLTEEDMRKASEALTIYVGDVQQKLSAFDEMARRVGKLMDIANDRFDYKKLRIHREQGFCVEGDFGGSVQLSDLSSGEQHELVLLYELLFRTPKNGLILVDEPEISLHVAWQSRFLSDLIGILELTDAYAVVATHSPVVIGNQWGLTVELKGPPKRPH
jgi:predicted ATPase